MSKVVSGSIFLNMPDGTRFRDINRDTNKPIGNIQIKTGLVKDVFGYEAIGFYEKDEITGEETSSRMLCPSACKFLIIKNNRG